MNQYVGLACAGKPTDLGSQVGNQKTVGLKFKACF